MLMLHLMTAGLTRAILRAASVHRCCLQHNKYWSASGIEYLGDTKSFKHLKLVLEFRLTSPCFRTYHRFPESREKVPGYRKCWTPAQVFSQTLAHGNSKNEIRQNREEQNSKYGRKSSRNEKNTCRRANYRLGSAVPLRALLPETVDELSN